MIVLFSNRMYSWVTNTNNRFKLTKKEEKYLDIMFEYGMYKSSLLITNVINGKDKDAYRFMCKLERYGIAKLFLKDI